MPIKCATSKTSSVLRASIGNFRRAFGLQRDTMKKIEGLVSDIPIWSKIGGPMFEAARQGRIWRSGLSADLEKLAGRMSAGETENILQLIIDPVGAARFFTPTAAQRASASSLEKLMMRTLKESGGLSDDQARQFLKVDFPRLRAAQGDPNRVSKNNIYPESFQPFLDDILSGHLSATQNNAYAVAWDLINLGERHRFTKPAAKAAVAEVTRWGQALKGQVTRDDVAFAQSVANDFIASTLEQRTRTSQVLAQTIGNTMNRINRAIGRKEIDVTDDTINRWALNMASWYGGLAMSARPALAVRNMTQVLLPATKVGYGRLGRALKDIYGKDRKDHISRALTDLGIPLEGEAPIFLNEGREGFLGSRFFRTIRAAQNQGLRPYRWADRVNNRATTYRMGELAIMEEAPLLQSGKITWEQFMMRTGLKGSPQVDQLRIKSLLQGKDLPNIPQASREYGKILVEDTQFIYDGVNSPMAFKGTVGRLFGQFGTWPIGFAEFMGQNAGVADAAWRTKFLGNYATQKLALSGVGFTTGIDTSSWNFANPLTFDGGPWFQALRDVAILGTSQNEFERRGARGGLERMIGRRGTASTSILNPFGAATTDILQAKAADSPLDATLLALGFNLRDVSPATRR